MKKFFILFAATCIASAAWSDAVYEPLIVSSGFNRDVIAETYPYTGSSVSYYQPYSTSTNAPYRKQHNHATKEVIRLTNDAENRGLTDEQKEYLATETGWPNDYGNPGDRIVNCLTDRYPGLYWKLAPYTAENALCLRNTSGCVNSGRLTFKNIGCYQKLYFLTFAGGAPTENDPASAQKRQLKATVYYSTGESDVHQFEFLDCSRVKPERQAHRCQIYSSGFIKGSLSDNTVYAAVSEMNVDTHRLIDSVHFSYDGSESTGIAIFAVTGLTADIAAPDANPAPNHAPLRAKEITQNTVSVEWDAVEGAASYRIDVATDENFHNMVAGFNNEAVITSPDTVITGLDADHEYYWRVRAVDSEGGQSASSAPRRVRTESSEGPQTSDEVRTDIKAVLDNYLQSTINLKIARVLYKDGSFNTLCLPFDYSADRIAAHEFLQGCELFTFDSAEQLGESQLDIRMSPATEITAGVPYLVRWANTGAVSDYLTFNSVTITKTVGDTVGEGSVRFIGAIGRQKLGEANDKNYLFVGANNTLYWPNTNNQLRGYRAYFRIFNSGSVPAPRYGTPARIVLQPKVATDIEITNTTSLESAKRIENGQLIIIHGGVRYNVLGQKME